MSGRHCLPPHSRAARRVKRTRHPGMLDEHFTARAKRWSLCVPSLTAAVLAPADRRRTVDLEADAPLLLVPPTIIDLCTLLIAADVLLLVLDLLQRAQHSRPCALSRGEARSTKDTSEHPYNLAHQRASPLPAYGGCRNLTSCTIASASSRVMFAGAVQVGC